MNAIQLAAASAHASTGLGVGPEIGVGAGLLLIGIAIGAAVMRGRLSKPGMADGQRAPQPPPDPSQNGEGERRVDDSALVQSLIGLDERARGAAWQPLVTAALSACGIVADYPLSEMFDASRHRVVDTGTTADPAQNMRICEVERPGYLRWEASISPADVIVLRYRPDRTSGAGR